MEEVFHAIHFLHVCSYVLADLFLVADGIHEGLWSRLCEFTISNDYRFKREDRMTMIGYDERENCVKHDWLYWWIENELNEVVSGLLYAS